MNEKRKKIIVALAVILACVITGIIILVAINIKQAEPQEAKKKESYKGLTYEYMEKYIKAHDEDGSIMAEYEMLRGISEEAEEAFAQSLSYMEMKDWFLHTYPAIADFHKKREEIMKKVA